MNKLKRYKKTKLVKLNKLFYNIHNKCVPDVEILQHLSFLNYKIQRNKILTLKKVPQKQYTTNLDVCNID